MNTGLHEINVTLSKNQKERLYKAFHDRESILLRLKNDALRGSDTLLVPSIELPSKFIHPYDGREIPMFNETVIEELERKRKKEKGMKIYMDYSDLNDLIKDSVARNVEKLIEYDADCYEFIDNEIMIENDSENYPENDPEYDPENDPEYYSE